MARRPSLIALTCLESPISVKTKAVLLLTTYGWYGIVLHALLLEPSGQMSVSLLFRIVKMWAAAHARTVHASTRATPNRIGRRPLLGRALILEFHARGANVYFNITTGGRELRGAPLNAQPHRFTKFREHQTGEKQMNVMYGVVRCLLNGLFRTPRVSDYSPSR